MIKFRPFVSAMVAREVRRHATKRLNVHQFSVPQYDQFVAKLRTRKVVDAVCDFFDSDEDFDIRTIRQYIMKKWVEIRGIVDGFLDVNLEMPEMFYNVAPKRNGRRAGRVGIKYQSDADFLSDKEAFYEELNEDRSSGTV